MAEIKIPPPPGFREPQQQGPYPEDKDELIKLSRERIREEQERQEQLQEEQERQAVSQPTTTSSLLVPPALSPMPSHHVPQATQEEHLERERRIQEREAELERQEQPQIEYVSRDTVGPLAPSQRYDPPTEEEISRQMEEWKAGEISKLDEARAQYLAELGIYAKQPGEAGRPYGAYLAETMGLSEIDRWYNEQLQAIEQGETANRELLLGGAQLQELGKARSLAMQQFQSSESAKDYESWLEATAAEYQYIGDRETPGELVKLYERMGATPEQIDLLYEYSAELSGRIVEVQEDLGTPEEYAAFLRQVEREEMPEGWVERFGWALTTGGGLGKVGRAMYAGVWGDKWVDPAAKWMAETIDNPWSSAVYELYTHLPGYQRGEEQYRAAGGTPEFFSLGGVANPYAWGRGIWEYTQSGNPADIFKSMAGIMYSPWQTERQREKQAIYEELGTPSGWAISFTHPAWVASMFVGAGQADALGKLGLRGISTASTRLQATKLVASSTKLTTLVKAGEKAAGAPIRSALWSGEFAGRTVQRIASPVTELAKLPIDKAMAKAVLGKIDDTVKQAAKSQGIGIAPHVTTIEGVKMAGYILTVGDRRFYANTAKEVADYVLKGHLINPTYERYFIPSTNRILAAGDPVALIPRGADIYPESLFRMVDHPADVMKLSTWEQGRHAFAVDNFVKSMHGFVLADIPSLAAHSEVALSNTFAKQVMGKFRNVPYLRDAINAIDPNAFVTMGDPIGSVVAGWHQMGSTWEMFVRTKLAEIAKMERIVVEEVVEGNITKPIVKGVQVNELGASKGMTEAILGEVMEHPQWFDMSDNMRATIKAMHSVIDESFEALKKYGIDIHTLGFAEGDHYFPRYVLGKNAQVIETKGGGGAHIMTKAKFEKTRLFDTMKEGVDQGYVYMKEPLAILDAHLMTTGRRIADAEFARMIKPQGLTQNEMRELMAPGLARDTSRLKNTWKQNEKLHGLISRTERGESLPEGSLQFIERYNPDVGRQLRAYERGEIVPNESFWNGLKDNADIKAASAKATFLEKQVELLRVSNLAKSHPKWGRDLTSASKKRISEMTARGLTPDTSEELRRLQELVRRAEGFVDKEGKQVAARRVEDYGFSGTWFPEDVADRLNKVLGETNHKWLTRLEDVNALTRFMMTGMDFGVGQLQGLPLLAINPVKWGEAQLRSLQVFGANMIGRGETTYARYLASEANMQAIGEIGRAGRSIVLGRTEFTQAAGRQGLAGKTVGRVPILGRTQQSFALSFEMWGDVARLEMYKSLRHMATTPEELAALIDFVNKSTGVTSTKALGIPATQRQIEASILLFSPRYFRSSMALTADIMRGGMRGQLARDAMASMMASGVVYYYATCKALGQEPNFDPRSSGFLGWMIGDDHHGIGSIWVANARLLGNIYTTATDRPEDFLDWRIWEHDARRDNPLWKYLSGRVAPLTGTGIDIITGKTYIGEPLDTPYDYWEQAIQRNLLPFWIDAQITEDPRPGLTAIPGEMLGLRVWAMQPWELRNKRRDELAMRDYGVTWQQLGEAKPKGNTSELWGDLAKKKIIEENPDLQQLTAEAQERRLRRGDDLDVLIKEYFDDRDRYRITRHEAWGQAEKNFYHDLELQKRYNEGDITLTEDEIFRAQNAAKTFREAYTEANRVYGAQLRDRDQNERYDSVREEFDSWHQEGQQDEYIGDQAYDDWTTIMYGNPELINEFGEYDYDKADELILEFKAKWGTKWYDYVRAVENSNRSVTIDGVEYKEPQVVTNLRKAQKLLKPYWRIGDKYKGLYPEVTQEELSTHRNNLIVTQLRTIDPYLADMYVRMKDDPAWAQIAQQTPEWGNISKLIDAVRQPIMDWKPITYNQVVDAAQWEWRYEHPEADMALQLFYGRAPLDASPPKVGTGFPPETSPPNLTRHLQWR